MLRSDTSVSDAASAHSEEGRSFAHSLDSLNSSHFAHSAENHRYASSMGHSSERHVSPHEARPRGASSSRLALSEDDLDFDEPEFEGEGEPPARPPACCVPQCCLECAPPNRRCLGRAQPCLLT